MSKKICKGGGKSKPGKDRYECKKCGMSALREKFVCKPKDIG